MINFISIIITMVLILFIGGIIGFLIAHQKYYMSRWYKGFEKGRDIGKMEGELSRGVVNE